MIIGYVMTIKFRLFGNLDVCKAFTLYEKYYLNFKDTNRGVNKLWLLEKIPMIEVGCYCVCEEDEKMFPKAVDKIHSLMI